jgi:hypothetical protein
MGGVRRVVGGERWEEGGVRREEWGGRSEEWGVGKCRCMKGRTARTSGLFNFSLLPPHS